jgi:hypothetical protein
VQTGLFVPSWLNQSNDFGRGTLTDANSDGVLYTVTTGRERH